MVKPRKRAKRKDSGRTKEASVLIPLTYNDGSRVAADTIESIMEEIYIAFHGWTVEGVVKGAYRMQSGRKAVEDLLKVAIVLDGSQIPELEAMVAKWCRSLGQETMLLKIADYVIKFVPPDRDGGSREKPQQTS